ncbi:hypothetical protein [Amaricoccus sp.]|uniref:hypothetical protein n=1 Tax=Amaricoccus sp. TaxID=1872485 RepID=UPI001B4991C1|nr:hypothetical protein [Amaricoccus sp.]MBP7002290.1 hypothetical protein [Amaricoccus sp.]
MTIIYADDDQALAGLSAAEIRRMTPRPGPGLFDEFTGEHVGELVAKARQRAAWSKRRQAAALHRWATWAESRLTSPGTPRNAPHSPPQGPPPGRRNWRTPASCSPDKMTEAAFTSIDFVVRRAFTLLGRSYRRNDVLPDDVPAYLCARLVSVGKVHQRLSRNGKVEFARLPVAERLRRVPPTNRTTSPTRMTSPAPAPTRASSPAPAASIVDQAIDDFVARTRSSGERQVEYRVERVVADPDQVEVAATPKRRRSRPPKDFDPIPIADTPEIAAARRQAASAARGARRRAQVAREKAAQVAQEVPAQARGAVDVIAPAPTPRTPRRGKRLTLFERGA